MVSEIFIGILFLNVFEVIFKYIDLEDNYNINIINNDHLIQYSYTRSKIKKNYVFCQIFKKYIKLCSNVLFVQKTITITEIIIIIVLFDKLIT